MRIARRSLGRWLTVALVLTVVLTCWPQQPASAALGSWGDAADTTWYDTQVTEGKGSSAGNPFIITTAEELAGLAALTNAGNSFSGKHIRLDADLDLGDSYWVPIGTSIDCPFSGTFNGNGHVIRSLTYVDSTFGDAGLFGHMRATTAAVGGAGISDLGLPGVSITGSASAAGGLVGSIDFQNWTARLTITRCFVTGTVSSGHDTTAQVGALVGHVWFLGSNDELLFTLSDSYSAADVSLASTDGTYTRYGGGLVGHLTNSTPYCDTIFSVTRNYSTSRVTTGSRLNTFTGSCIGGVTNWTGFTITDCLFDFQATGVGWAVGGVEEALAGTTAVRTSEITGTGALLAAWSTSVWQAQAAPDLYPKLLAFAGAADASLASTLPIRLYENTTIPQLSDTSVGVRRSFTVPVVTGVTWASSAAGILAVDNGTGDVTFTSPGVDTEVTLTATVTASGFTRDFTVLCKSGVDTSDTTPPGLTFYSITPQDFRVSVIVNSDETADLYALVKPAAEAAPSAVDIVSNPRTLGPLRTTSLNGLFTGLAHSTDYVVYAMGVDATGNVSDVVSQSFTTLQDQTPPRLVGYSAPAAGATTVSFSISYNEAGTVEWVILPAADAAPSNLQVSDGLNAAGEAAFFRASAGAPANPAPWPTYTTDTSGFVPGDYKIYVVCEDDYGNVSTLTTTSTFTVPRRDNDITGFSVAGQVESSTIDAAGHTVSFRMPYGTDVTALPPTITVSDGATVDPASGAATDFSSGPVTYTVTAENGAEQAWTVTCAIEPSVEITAPVDDAIVGPRPTFTAAADGGAGGIASVFFYFTGWTPVDISTDTVAPYEADWGSQSLPNGAVTLYAVATDGEGFTDLDSVSVTVDAQGPGTDMTTTVGTYVRALGAISGTASDPSGVSAVEVRVQGPGGAYWGGGDITDWSDSEIWLPATQDGPDWSSWTFSTSVWLSANGSYTVTARATDAFGNVDSTGDAVTFTFDDTPPSITGHTPISDEIVGSASPSFTVTASDGLSGVNRALMAWWDNVTYNGSDPAWQYFPMNYSPDVDGTFTADWVAAGYTLPEGQIKFWARVYDTAGNDVATAFYATVDTTAPTVAITAPGDGSSISDPATGLPRIYGTATDANLSGVLLHIHRERDNRSWSPSGAGSWVDLEDLAFSLTGTTDWEYAATSSWLTEEGRYTITAYADDTVDNESSATATFIYDCTAPGQPTVLGVAAGGTTSLVLNWAAATDPAPASGGEASGLAGYNVYVSETETGAFTRLNDTLVTGTTYTHSGLTAGTTRWYEITAVDRVGNESPLSAAVSGRTHTGGGGGTPTPGAPDNVFTGTFDPAEGGSVDGDTFTLEAPADVLDAADGSQLTVTVTIHDADEVAAALEGASVPDGFTALQIGFELAAVLRTATGETNPVTSFDEPMVLRLELSPDDLAGITDPEKVGLFRVNADGSLTFVGGRLETDSAGHTYLVVELWGFSQYVVGEVGLTFTDLTLADGTAHWAKDDIELMASKYVVNGMGGGLFDPAGPVTRAQFACMLGRAAGLPVGGGAGGNGALLGFTDVEPGDWFYDELAAAVEADLIEGFDDGTFRPHAPVTREQVAVMVGRALAKFGLAGNLTAEQASTVLGAFGDWAEVSAWAQSGLALAVSEGIVTGQGGQVLAPQAGATRAEAAVMIARFWRME